VQHVRAGELAPADTVVFLHTGGMPALFTESFLSAFPLQASTGTAG
jgi:1-aminocyclopropane-1-carboxylate deaminase/D-cysteine desulfhydrase-like pyridoxal-dependent ACC family enzyme